MRKYRLNENFFDVLNEKSVYWLGFLYADGYVRIRNDKSGEIRIKLKNSDKNHIETFLVDLESNAPIKCGISKNDNSKFCYTTIGSKYMVKKLFDLGCVQNKTLKIRLPELRPELMPHFVRGYFDGDGSISKIKSRPNCFVVSICSNKNFNKDLIKYLNFGKIYEAENYSVIKINKIEEVKKFRDIIYRNGTIFLKRKFNIFKEVRDNFSRDYSKTKNKKKYKLTSPNGSVIISDHLRIFCEKNNLVYSTMSNLARGIGKTNKGWKCELIKN